MLNDLPPSIQTHIERQGECWIWTGSRQAEGYGRVVRQGRSHQAHRATYELLIGPIPDGLQLDHLCRVTSCVNPAHLEPVTDLENKRRRYALYTHCTNGHAFTEANTYIKPSSGHRDCRTCIRDRVRRYAARKRGNAA